MNNDFTVLKFIFQFLFDLCYAIFVVFIFHANTKANCTCRHVLRQTGIYDGFSQGHFIPMAHSPVYRRPFNHKNILDAD